MDSNSLFVQKGLNFFQEAWVSTNRLLSKNENPLKIDAVAVVAL